MLNPAFAVDGGSGPASMFRTQLYAATGGANGVITGTDLQVTALDVPSAAVNVSPGGALMVSRYSTTSSTQTYAAVNDATVPISIPSTGSGAGRTDYLILKIDDWHFDPSVSQPSDPVNATYCSLERVSSLNGLTYPYVALAQITIPASTTTITQAMITDLRQVANPRKERVLRVCGTTWSTQEQLTSTAANGQAWPNAGGEQDVFIPSWATNVKIVATWAGVRLPAGNCQARVWVSFGPWNGTTWGTNSQDYGIDNVSSQSDTRTTIVAADSMPIPKNLRGTTTHFQLWGKLYGKVGPICDGWSGVTLDLEFEELPDISTS